MEILDYHKLKIFKTVADTGSFSKAAQLLFLSQPTVTLQIKKIENYLGVTLFRRDKKNVVLTEEGKILYEYATKIIEDYLLMEEKLSYMKENVQKNLVIGASTTVGEFLLPEVITSFLKNRESINVHIYIGNSKEIEEGILSKNFYVGLVEDEIISNKFDKIEFFKDEIILIGANRKNLPDVIEKDQLLEFKLIFREIGSGTRNIVEKYLKKAGIDIKPHMEIGSSKAISKMVSNSDCFAFVSKLVVKDDIKYGKLKEIKVNNLSITRSFTCITQKNVRLPKLEREFLNYLLDNTTFKNVM
ncbi:LysR substrate-binding domain-containing protein [Persephonella sp.]